MLDQSSKIKDLEKKKGHSILRAKSEIGSKSDFYQL